MTALPVRYRRVQRGQFLQKLQHDPHGASLALGVAEVVVSVLVIGSVIRGLRQLLSKTRAPAGHARRHLDAYRLGQTSRSQITAK